MYNTCHIVKIHFPCKALVGLNSEPRSFYLCKALFVPLFSALYFFFGAMRAGNLVALRVEDENLKHFKGTSRSVSLVR